MTSIVVTGASGFIGRHVIDYLAAHKPHANIIAVSRKPVSFAQSNVRNIVYDIKQPPHAALFEDLQKPDILIHLAWSDLHDFRSLSHVTETLPAHVLFLSSLLAQGLKNLTVTGTCLEYGLQEGALDETSNTSPILSYGIAKDALFKTLTAIGSQHHFALKWLRLFYMYGNGQNPKSLLPSLDKALANGDAEFNLSPGDQLRDYLPVEDVAETIAKAALQEHYVGAINVSSGRPLSVKDVVTQHLAKKGQDIKLQFGYYPYPTYEPFAFWGVCEKRQHILAMDASS